jgi:non-ribosomal peptide synthase protein (TIGR01720 family)
VGWFTAAFPLTLDLRDTHIVGDALRIANKRLRDLPGNGVPFGLLATYHPDPAIRDRLTQMAATQISFNYHGKLDPETGSGGTGVPRISLAPEKHGTELDPASPPARQLEVTCAVTGGALRTEFAYLPAVYNHDGIRRLADSFTAALHEFLSLENLPAAERFSLTGIADVEMDGQGWQNLITELGFEGPEPDESE